MFIQGLVLLCFDCFADAKREILKQIGGNLSDSEQQNTSLIERPRRPGMPGHDKRFKLHVLVLLPFSYFASSVPFTTHSLIC